jgi:hypothetical protein
MREIAALAASGELPVLLATPTSANGQLDPDTLISRLQILESAGVAPGMMDLQQALLRLPRELDAGLTERAARLSSPAGHAMAGWLAAGGLPDPVVSCVPLTLPMRQYIGYPSHTTSTVDVPRVLATISPPETRNDIARSLCELPGPGGWEGTGLVRHVHSVEAWPWLLPSHREVVAAHLVPCLSELTESRLGQGTALLRLAESDGPAGAALATALTYGLGSRHQDERSASVDALLVLAGRGQTPAEELGTAISSLVPKGLVVLSRVTAGLTDAVRAGAHADLWSIVAAALPGLLPVHGQAAAPGLPDLLALGAEAAEAIGARADLPALAEVAGRGGSSRLVREAARLNRLVGDHHAS